MNSTKRGFAISASDRAASTSPGKPSARRGRAAECLCTALLADIFHFVGGPGHRLLFRFHANDLGKARFGGSLCNGTAQICVLERYDTSIRFVKVRP